MASSRRIPACVEGGITLKAQLKLFFETVAGTSWRNRKFASLLRGELSALLLAFLPLAIGYAVGRACLAAFVHRRDPVDAWYELATVEPAAPSLESAVYAVRGGKVYHRPDCPHLPKTPGRELQWYASAEAATREGLRPCKSCLRRNGSV